MAITEAPPLPLREGIAKMLVAKGWSREGRRPSLPWEEMNRDYQWMI